MGSRLLSRSCFENLSPLSCEQKNTASEKLSWLINFFVDCPTKKAYTGTKHMNICSYVLERVIEWVMSKVLNAAAVMLFMKM